MSRAQSLTSEKPALPLSNRKQHILTDSQKHLLLTNMLLVTSSIWDTLLLIGENILCV